MNTEILQCQMKLPMGSTTSSGAQEEPELAVLEDAVILAQVEYPCRRAGDLGLKIMGTALTFGEFT